MNLESYGNGSNSSNSDCHSCDTVETMGVGPLDDGDSYLRLGRITSPDVRKTIVGDGRNHNDFHGSEFGDGFRMSKCEKIRCPPSVGRDHLHLHPHSQSSPSPSSSPSPTSKNNPSSACNNINMMDSSNDCIKHPFDEETLASARSLAYTFANPCGVNHHSSSHETDRSSSFKPYKSQRSRQRSRSRSSSQSHSHSHPHSQSPPPCPTPSTVGSSFSDDSQETASMEASPNNTTKRELLTRPRRSSFLSDGGFRPVAVDKDEEGSRSLTPACTSHYDCVEPGTREIVVLVGDQEYPLPGNSIGFVSKYFWSHRKKVNDRFSYVDLSTHSPDEFEAVMEFFAKNGATDAWETIHWKNLAVVLPWFVEFKALPLLSAVDTFVLQNGLRAGVGRENERGAGAYRSHRQIGLSNLLMLTQIAFRCGLESTKSHARKLVKQFLLEPRKLNGSGGSSPSVSVSGTPQGSFDEHKPALEAVAEDIELEWTLDDLRTLSEILFIYDDLREYLWDSAVIVYLPHDLDISNSLGLVENHLFPYLLREGMMQMMIVEGIRIESSSENNSSNSNSNSNNLNPLVSFTNDHSFATLAEQHHGGIGFSYSESTSCSDTTIPTNPSIQRNRLGDDEMAQCLWDITASLDKFGAEKDARTFLYEDHENSLLADSSFDAVGSGYHHHRADRTKKSSRPSAVRERETATFAC